MTCRLAPLVPPPASAPPLTLGDAFDYRDAILFARQTHAGQKRADGRPFITHPLATLQILRSASTELPLPAYVAALLHDTVEDGRATIALIRRNFGPDAADAVDALTRSERPARVSALVHERAYLDRMAVAHERLPFVLHIKMADRIHNLETAHFLAPGRRRALRDQTATLYLPFFRKHADSPSAYGEAYHILSVMLRESVHGMTEAS